MSEPATDVHARATRPLSIPIAHSSLAHLLCCSLVSPSRGEHEIDHLMFCQKEVSFSANPNEVCEVKYVSSSELRDEFALAKENPEHLTPWFQMISEQLLFGWWEQGRLAEVMKAGGLGKEEEALIRVLTLEGKPDTFIPEQTP